MAKKNTLTGLKADDMVTEERPPLNLLFLPRFWGSLDSRYENGKTHLVPQVLRGWDEARATLCGRRVGESDHPQLPRCDSRPRRADNIPGGGIDIRGGV